MDITGCFVFFKDVYPTFPFQRVPFQFRFAILVAGFKSNSLQHGSVYSERITIPTLHVFGDTDQVIPKGKKTFLSPPIEEKSCGCRNKRTFFVSFFTLRYEWRFVAVFFGTHHFKSHWWTCHPGIICPEENVHWFSWKNEEMNHYLLTRLIINIMTHEINYSMRDLYCYYSGKNM